MLFQKLNKAKNTNVPKQGSIPHARHNLEIFSQLRSSDQATPDSSLTEEDIISALDQELFRGDMDNEKNFSAQLNK